MPKIELITLVKADVHRCFDLSRSIDLHKISTSKTKEEAIDGRITGLIELGETVTWQARHFGFRQKLTVKITAFERPSYFVDEQIQGIFKYMRHQHFFEEINDDMVRITDVFEFEAPFGVIGKIFNRLVLTNYMTKFLRNRNKVIKEYAESEKWKTIIDSK